MSKYDNLYKILDKKSISLDELRKLANNDLVVSIENKPSDKKYFYKYDIKLDNSELYYVYVKKSLSDLIKTFNE